MKKLIIIHGPPGVGKTTVCRSLYKSLDKSVWLDGDWCWMMNPFIVTEENKQMIIDNITHLLHNFLKNSSFDKVVFNWVIPKEYIFDTILRELEDLEFELFKITLVCSRESLQKRMEKDTRTKDQINSSIESMRYYNNMKTLKVDTSDKQIDEIVFEIKDLLIDEND